MAIATHNIKVNGRWVRPGESYEPESVQVTMPVEAKKRKTEAPEELKTEEPKSMPKPRATTRRKGK